MLAVSGGAAAVTQVAGASTNRDRRNASRCTAGDAAAVQPATRCRRSVRGVGNGGRNRLRVLTDSCDTSNLPPHDGFQKGDRCVATEFGEVSAAEANPSLLITRAPRRVRVNQPFTLTVSSRNLIRDRFLAAGQGGYYVESSVLRRGIERGHFHTACRIIPNTRKAPPPAAVPAFFVATEDQRGGRGEDKVRIRVPGLPEPGTFQCASWSGDGSHRVPMMERADQVPAIDAVWIEVAGGGYGRDDDDRRGR